MKTTTNKNKHSIPTQQKKKIRRSKRKTKDISLLYNNINGFKTKMESLKIIIEKQQPDIIALCETKLGKNSQGLVEETLVKQKTI